MANNGRKRKSYIDSLPDRVFHGFTFRQGRPLKDGARRLICSHAESHACDALGTLSATDDFSYVPKKEKHTHERDPDAEIKARFTRDLYIATKHQFRTLQIIYDEIALLHEEGAALLSFNDINRKMQAWLENRVLPEVTSIGDIKLQLNDPLFKNINLHNAGKTEIEFVQDEEGQDTAMILVDANLLSQLETTTLFIQSTDHKFEGVDNLQLTSISTKHMDHVRIK
ncbi:GSCOCG00011681001-RA-CDS [Cotesia congregata]|nr:GSCOCG00011681001-RA-CDS [Cotesia congregata]